MGKGKERVHKTRHEWSVAEYRDYLGKRGATTGARPAKYKNVPVWVDGVYFPSKHEAKRWKQLLVMQQAGVITELRRQVLFVLAVDGVRVTAYRADFTYRDAATGEMVVEDAKGFRTPDYKIKRRLMLALLKIDVREV